MSAKSLPPRASPRYSKQGMLLACGTYGSHSTRTELPTARITLHTPTPTSSALPDHISFPSTRAVLGPACAQGASSLRTRASKAPSANDPRLPPLYPNPSPRRETRGPRASRFFSSRIMKNPHPPGYTNMIHTCRDPGWSTSRLQRLALSIIMYLPELSQSLCAALGSCFWPRPPFFFLFVPTTTWQQGSRFPPTYVASSSAGQQVLYPRPVARHRTKEKTEKRKKKEK